MVWKKARILVNIYSTYIIPFCPCSQNKSLFCPPAGSFQGLGRGERWFFTNTRMINQKGIYRVFFGVIVDRTAAMLILHGSSNWFTNPNLSGLSMLALWRQQSTLLLLFISVLIDEDGIQSFPGSGSFHRDYDLTIRLNTYMYIPTHASKFLLIFWWFATFRNMRHPGRHPRLERPLWFWRTNDVFSPTKPDLKE